jgi:hypothetical protein
VSEDQPTTGQVPDQVREGSYDAAARARLVAVTDEGTQQLAPVGVTGATELAIEKGGVLRIPESDALDPDAADATFGTGETMILNVGPQACCG